MEGWGFFSAATTPNLVAKHRKNFTDITRWENGSSELNEHGSGMGSAFMMWCDGRGWFVLGENLKPTVGWWAGVGFIYQKLNFHYLICGGKQNKTFSPHKRQVNNTRKSQPAISWTGNEQQMNYIWTKNYNEKIKRKSKENGRTKIKFSWLLILIHYLHIN